MNYRQVFKALWNAPVGANRKRYEVIYDFFNYELEKQGIDPAMETPEFMYDFFCDIADENTSDILGAMLAIADVVEPGHNGEPEGVTLLNNYIELLFDNWVETNSITFADCDKHPEWFSQGRNLQFNIHKGRTILSDENKIAYILEINAAENNNYVNATIVLGDGVEPEDVVYDNNVLAFIDTELKKAGLDLPKLEWVDSGAQGNDNDEHPLFTIMLSRNGW